MHYGVSIFPTRYSIGPAELARAVEERGFESLFVPEHTHIPVSRRSPWPGGGELPREYRETLDPFLALTAAAMATERLLLGTGICLVIERDPITTAKGWPPSTCSPAAGSCSASAAAGTGRRWRTTGPTRPGASPSSGSACWP